MALVKKRSNSSRLIIISIVVVVVAGVGYFLYQQFFLNNETATQTNTSTERTKRVLTKFGEDILKDPRYQALQPYGTDPIPPAGTNPNPFQ